MRTISVPALRRLLVVFATRVLGFERVIELYKPAPQRRYGYYVLPFLSGATGSSGAPI